MPIEIIDEQLVGSDYQNQPDDYNDEDVVLIDEGVFLADTAEDEKDRTAPVVLNMPERY